MDATAPTAPSSASRGESQRPFTLVAPLLRASLALGVAGGFALAAVLTLARAFQLSQGTWWIAAAQAHGHLQLYGWAGLFVFGVASHFLPRLRGTPLALPQLIPWVGSCLVASLVLRGVSQPLLAATGSVAWRVGLVGSGILECAAMGLFLVVLLTTAWRGGPLRSRAALWSILPFLVVVWMALGTAMIVNLVNVSQAALSPLGLVQENADMLNVTLGLFGFLIPMALAMSARALPMYAGLDAFPTRVLWPLAGAYGLGVLLAAVGTISGAETDGWSGRCYGLGLMVIGLVVVIFVSIFMRMMRSRGRLPQRVSKLSPSPAASSRAYTAHVSKEKGAYGPFVPLVASSYMWAIVGSILLLIDGVALILGRTAPVSLDAARHSFALGFIALLICGVAPRMLPGFSGGRITSPALVTATLWLGNAAALLRVGSLLAAPALTALGATGATLDTAAFGLSGPLGLALAICLAANLWPTLTVATAHRS